MFVNRIFDRFYLESDFWQMLTCILPKLHTIVWNTCGYPYVKLYLIRWSFINGVVKSLGGSLFSGHSVQKVSHEDDEDIDVFWLFQLSSDDIEQFGIPPELCTSLLLLAKKLSSLALSVEEYVLLKAIVLLNPGLPSRCLLCWCVSPNSVYIVFYSCYCLCWWVGRCVSCVDVDVMSPMSVESARHDVFDALLMYTRSQGCRRGRRVSDVLLALPLLTRLVSAGCEFWRQTKARGHVTAHRLLSEMVDRILTSLWRHKHNLLSIELKQRLWS